MKKFNVHYQLSFHSSIEVEAETAEEAEAKVRDMIDTEKLNVNDMELADQDIYAD